MSLGRILATSAIKEDKYATYIPSYGAEVRGGTAYCFVRVSASPIASPLVEKPDVAIILNQQSLNKFKWLLDKHCLLVLNSDTIKDKPQLPVKKIIYPPLNKIAIECGSIKCVNILALGIVLACAPEIIKRETVVKVIKEVFADEETAKINVKALYKGENYDR